MTLPTIAGVQARIHTLPGRPPFMTVYDLAEFYETTPKRIMEQVRRNIGRFPEGFVFELTEAEKAVLITQNAASNRVQHGVLMGFTKLGALQLSSVLTGTVADAVSVTIMLAFAEIETREQEEIEVLREQLEACHHELLISNPRFAQIYYIWRPGEQTYWQVKPRGLGENKYWETVNTMQDCGMITTGEAGDAKPETVTSRLRSVQSELNRALGRLEEAGVPLIPPPPPEPEPVLGPSHLEDYLKRRGDLITTEQGNTLRKFFVTAGQAAAKPEA